MPKKASAEDVKDVLVQNRQAALAYAEGVGTGRVRELLAFAEQDLLSRIESFKGSGTFTEANLNAVLRQVRAVAGNLTENLTGTFVDEAGNMAEMAAGGTIDYMMQADEAFRGLGTKPLAFREASVLDSAKEGARSSLLRRIASSGDGTIPGADPSVHPGKMGVLERYGMNTIGEFEKILRVGVITRKSVDQVKGDLTEASPFLQGKPGFWAERIARTELMGAYNRAGWEAQREVDDQMGGDDAVRILCATFDNRTASDSYAVHGQIRRPEEAFETWYGMMQHPPARPNDREIVVPHRIAWPIPDYLKQRSWGEVVARWIHEGKSGAPPGRPLMTTVDLDKFGKEPEKKEDEETEPTAAMRDATAKGKLAEDIGDDALMDHGPTPDPDAQPQPILDEEEEDDVLKPEYVDDMAEGRSPSHVKHFLPHTTKGKQFWEGWSDAEQDLISKLSDDLVEKNETEAIAPGDVIHKGPDVNKQNLKYAIDDEQTPGMGYTPTVIKKDDLLYAYTGSATIVANNLLVNPTMQAHVVDLDDPKVAAQLEAVRPKGPPKLDAQTIMGEKTGAQKGSNKGGFYKGTDGVERYVKFYDDVAQAHCENIANQIYKKLGLSAPDSTTFEHEGKTGYAHATVPGTTLDNVGVTKKVATQILDGFAADILLGNRDVIGLSKDNILVTKDGVRRIDNGGSLLMRAQAGRKSTEDLHTLKEWDGFFDGSKNSYASVLDAAGVQTHADMKKQLVNGITNIKKLRDNAGGWQKLIEEIAPTMPGADRNAVVQMLDARTKLLEQKLTILRKRTPKAKPDVPREGMSEWGPAETTTYEDLLKKKDTSRKPTESRNRTPNGKTLGDAYTRGTFLGDADRAMQDHLESQHRNAIREFTGSDYGAIRTAARMTKEDFIKNGGSEREYDRMKQHADNIEEAFKKMPEDQRVPGTVFRGVMVPRAVANTMLAQNDKPHLPGLGAMFSTSREIGPAKGFLSSGAGDTHVFMVIKQKSGISIETNSVHKHEKEILMSGSTRCRLVEHYVTDFDNYYKNVLVLHLEEV